MKKLAVRNGKELSGNIVSLVGIEELKDYKSKETIGFNYIVLLEEKAFQRINVKIEGNKQVDDLQENEAKRLVEIEDLECTPYSLKDSSSVSYSFKAKSIQDKNSSSNTSTNEAQTQTESRIQKMNKQ